MQKVTPFQLRLIEELNREIKADAAIKGITKHDWIEKAIREQLKRERAV